MTRSTGQKSLSSIIKSARDVMRKDAGLNGDADRIPQFAWLLFLKAFDDLEVDREIRDANYRPALSRPYRWRDWAGDAKHRHSGERLLQFVNTELLPHLAGLQSSGNAGDTKQSLRDIFADTRNRMLSGYLLAELIDQVNNISFASADDIHTMAHMYESMLREMRDAAGDAGEFYTPRPVIRFMVGRIDPKLGEVVMDPAAGTGGFLVEAWAHLAAQATTAKRREKIKGTIRGFEKKPMPFLLGQMNMLLHDVDGAVITRQNALANQAADQRRDGVDIVLTNPPFGGEEESDIGSYFPNDMRTAETAWLFLQSVMFRITKSKSGRAAVVVPNGVLFSDGIGARIKKKLMSEFNLHTVVRLPNGVFSPYTLIPTNILFFDSMGPTEDVWFYEMSVPDGRKNYTKTKPLRYEEFADCESWWAARPTEREDNSHAWKVAASDIAANSYNLDLHNPHRPEDLAHRPPEELIAELIETELRILATFSNLQKDLAEGAN